MENYPTNDYRRRRHLPKYRMERESIGVVTETRGRRVLVRDARGERVCFLSGQRAVIGDEVHWREAKGTGGVLSEVLPRRTALRRLDAAGKEQILAANLEGVLVVVTPTSPPFAPELVDRYFVAARATGLEVAVVLHKTDLGVPTEVEEALALREVEVLRVSSHLGEGLDALRAHLARAAAPWALVGHSGVGKTSLLAALLPDLDVGPVGDISTYWEAGKHTTTGSRLFALPSGGDLADSPGIRNFIPAGLHHEDVRRHFPGMGDLPCRYRDCLHRPGEDGCAAPEVVPPALLDSYRRLLAEVTDATRPAYA